VSQKLLSNQSVSADQVLMEALVRSPLPAVLTDEENRVVFANHPACALLGLAPSGEGWTRGDVGEQERRAIDVRLDERVASGDDGWHQLGITDFGKDTAPISGMRVWASLHAERAAPAGDSPLTKREREVLGLVAGGLHTDEIAGHLDLSPETVKSHVHNAMTKLRASTRSQAVAIALSTGQVSYEAVPVPGS
jgi:DNA-binding CsgD family transcriptional regulator